MICFLICQVVGLLLPNQSLLSTIFWQVSRGSTFTWNLLSVSQSSAHSPTGPVCLTVFKPESQRLFQLLQPQRLSGSVSAYVAPKSYFQHVSPLDTFDAVVETCSEWFIVLFIFRFSLLRFPDFSGGTSERWPAPSPLLWVPIIPLTWHLTPALRRWRTAFARIIISKLCCKRFLKQENDQIQLKPFITNLISSICPLTSVLSDVKRV